MIVFTNKIYIVRDIVLLKIWHNVSILYCMVIKSIVHSKCCDLYHILSYIQGVIWFIVLYWRNKSLENVGRKRPAMRQNIPISTIYRYLASQKLLAVLNPFRILRAPRRRRSLVLDFFTYWYKCKIYLLTYLIHVGIFK